MRLDFVSRSEFPLKLVRRYNRLLCKWSAKWDITLGRLWHRPDGEDYLAGVRRLSTDKASNQRKATAQATAIWKFLFLSPVTADGRGCQNAKRFFEVELDM